MILNFRRLYLGNGARYKLLLITNEKSHMSFRLVPNSVTLNGVRAMCYFTEFGSFQAHYVKVVEDILTLSAGEM